MSAIAEKISYIQEHSGVKGFEVAQMLSTTAETVSRWKNGKSQPQGKALDHLLRIDYLIQELSELYKPANARLWLISPHKQLDGKRPIDLIASHEIERVRDIIDQLKTGAFA